MKYTLCRAVAVAAAALVTLAGPASAGAGLNTAALDAAVRITDGDNAAADLALVGGDGEVWQGADGDRLTGQPVARNAHYRIGSVSKVFESVVVLQLAAQGCLDLDAQVRRYLPGVLPPAFDTVTVRELLNHTSGLPAEDEGAPPLTPDQVIAGRYDYRSFAEDVHDTLFPDLTERPAPGPHFAPGTRQEYSSFAYRVAGLLIERVTGHSFAEEVRDRITGPLGMHETSVPERDPRIPTPYLHGYYTGSNGSVVDVSEQAGLPSTIISTPAEVDRFLVAVLHGDLLPPAQQQLLFTMPVGPDGRLLCDVATGGPGTQCFSDGGLMSTRMPDGTVLWGKTGHDIGYASGVFATRDLSRHGVYAVSRIAEDNGAAPALAQRIGAAAFAKPQGG
ncbi:serine hydrolase domain-containing protein [Nocardia sp. NPDC060256]|uniref:serine hydrolase domain-containing protein n=1 Tax=unclassified Nocardia TaxID=2637762 RepID=UPI00365F8AEA